MSRGGSASSALPVWIRDRKVRLGDLHQIKARMRQGKLHTVCEEARCPNRSECFSSGVATFLINGRVCTRSCGYCAIASGRPEPLAADEPAAVVAAAVAMNLRHVVITSVDRDDLDDGGAGAFGECLRRFRALDQPPAVEVLTPDFRGDMKQVDRILAAAPEVYNHNVETVPRLYPKIRRSGRYRWACEVLQRVAASGTGVLAKSGIMVGLGETSDEVTEVLGDLAEVGCRTVTIGQYLQPTPRQVPVERYWPPDELADLAAAGEALGLQVLSGPFVRSSYRAGEIYQASAPVAEDPSPL